MPRVRDYTKFIKEHKTVAELSRELVASKLGKRKRSGVAELDLGIVRGIMAEVLDGPWRDQEILETRFRVSGTDHARPDWFWGDITIKFDSPVEFQDGEKLLNVEIEVLPIMYYVAATYENYTMDMVQQHVEEIQEGVFERTGSVHDPDVPSIYLEAMKRFNRNLPADLRVWLELR